MRWFPVMLIVIAVSVHLCPQAQAATPTTVEPRIEKLTTFAEIKGGTESIRRIDLPLGVLQLSAQSSPGEFGVFDANGQLMPSKVYTTKVRVENQHAEAVLDFFPFNVDADPETVRISFQVDQGAGNKRFNVAASSQSIQEVNRQAITNYIVRVSNKVRDQSGTLTYLVLDWMDVANNLIVPLRIEGSTNLQSWQTLNDRVVVSDLQHAGTSLIRNRVGLRAFDGEYLRITWPEGESRFVLRRVLGGFTRNEQNVSTLRQDTLVCAWPDSLTCAFELPALVTTASIALSSNQPEYFVEAKWYSASTIEGPWTYWGAFQQYRLNVDSEIIHSAQTMLPRTNDGFWQLRFSRPFEQSEPQTLELQWNPVHLAFLAQGEAPYQLGFGVALAADQQVDTMDRIIKQVGKRIDQIEAVQLGPLQARDYTPPFWTRKKIETYLLWSVLLIGVAVLFRLALKLYRNIDSEGTS